MGSLAAVIGPLFAPANVARQRDKSKETVRLINHVFWDFSSTPRDMSLEVPSKSTDTLPGDWDHCRPLVNYSVFKIYLEVPFQLHESASLCGLLVMSPTKCGKHSLSSPKRGKGP